MTADLLTALNANLIAAGGRFAEHASEGELREFGSITVGTTGMPIPAFNRVLLTDMPSAEDYAEALEWMVGSGLPFWVMATDTAVEAIERFEAPVHLERIGTMPGMARHLDEITVPDSPATISEVIDEATLNAFSRIFSTVFGAPLDASQSLLSSSLLDDDHLRLFIGRVDDDAVAAGMLVRNNDIAGIYNIGVVEGYRRRGIGEAMTRRVLQAGLADGCRVAVLQSSDMAVPLYERLGFERVGAYHNYQYSD